MLHATQRYVEARAGERCVVMKLALPASPRGLRKPSRAARRSRTVTEPWTPCRPGVVLPSEACRPDGVEQSSSY